MDFRRLITLPEPPGQLRVMTLRFEPKRDANGRPMRGFKAACQQERMVLEDVLREQTT